MRIAIGSIQCEGNSLTPVKTKYEDFDINTLSDFSKINIKVEKTDNEYKTLKESSSSAFLVSVPSDKEITSSVTKEIKDSAELEKITIYCLPSSSRET